MSEEIGWSSAPAGAGAGSWEILDDGHRRPDSPEPAGTRPDERSHRLSGRSLRHRRPWIGPVALGIVAALAVASLVLDPGPGTPVGLTAPPDGPSDTPRTTPAQGESVTDQLTALKANRELFQDVVLPAGDVRSCHAAPTGRFPLSPASTALSHRLPGYEVVGSARWVDRSANLCEISLEAMGPGSAIAVLTVTPPTDPPDPSSPPQLTRTTSGGPGLRIGTSTVVQVVGGWVVQVGAIGPPASLPSDSYLLTLAADRRLRW